MAPSSVTSNGSSSKVKVFEAGPAREERRYQINVKVPHLTPHERSARGKAAREDAPRSSHAVFEPPQSGRDPIGLLEDQAVTRVQDLVPIRHGRMMASPFAFYRGAALVQAADLATTPSSGLRVQLCGDAHMSNFGIFASPERSMIFDLNDFDETLPGPFEWDVKRLAGSVAVAGRERGFSTKERASTLLATVGGYRRAIIEFAAQKNLDVWYAYVNVERELQTLIAQLDEATRRRTQRNVAKIRTKDNLDAFNKLTEVVDGRRRIVSTPPLVVPIEDLISAEDFERMIARIHTVLRGYRRTLQSDRRHLLEQFELVQVARKVVGVGSVGTRAWILLLYGRDGGDPLFLQAKEAEASVLERFVGVSEYTNHGQRVVAGQHLMQAASDIFLGWDRVEGIDNLRRDFYIRQLRDWKGSADIEHMNPASMAAYGGLCGWTLARAHARSGDRIAIASYLGKTDAFDRAVTEFAERYADQNERDFAALHAAVKDGRVSAVTGL
jgi:uncharacterized protein (DUF2252 family)